MEHALLAATVERAANPYIVSSMHIYVRVAHWSSRVGVASQWRVMFFDFDDRNLPHQEVYVGPDIEYACELYNNHTE